MCIKHSDDHFLKEGGIRTYLNVNGWIVKFEFIVILYLHVCILWLDEDANDIW